MPEENITALQKLDALQRELKYRRRVYPRLIAEGKMAESFAKAQIEMFEAMAEDYRKLAEKERLL